MTNLVNHEEAMVKAFIPAHRQERFLEIIAKPKKRAKLLTDLAHFKALNPEFMVAIPSNQRNPSALAKLLKAKGAGPSVTSCLKTPIGWTGTGPGNCTQGDRRISDGHTDLMRSR